MSIFTMRQAKFPQLVVQPFIWFLLAAPWLRSQPETPPSLSLDQFQGERLHYQMEYLNLRVATLDFYVAPDNERNHPQFFHLNITAKSTGAATWLFSVNNRYEIDLEQQTLLPVKIHKTIRQKNVAYQRTITFDHLQRQAACDDSLNWPIPEPCYDYFSMLYFLRTQPLILDDTLRFYLDSEYRLSNVEVVVLKEPKPVSVPAGRFEAIALQLKFIPGIRTSRPWKTDLLTNRLTAPGSELLVYFSNDRYRYPLKIFYQQTSVQTQIILDSFHKGQ
jgi:hypothetical protein